MLTRTIAVLLEAEFPHTEFKDLLEISLLLDHAVIEFILVLTQHA